MVPAISSLASKFQFHKGTIRTCCPPCAGRNLHQFQFHKGTIRTGVCTASKNDEATFQFHKGTIRTWLQWQSNEGNNYFNSIKVRLEQVEVIEWRMLQVFQFHKGTIRTENEAMFPLDPSSFQFHKGTIRTISQRYTILFIFISIP